MRLLVLAGRGREAKRAQARRLIGTVRDGDLPVEEAVLRLSRSRRWLAPLAFAVGAIRMLFEGVRLLLTNWRLALVQLLPAMWIWAAILDVKVHVFNGKTFHITAGPAMAAAVAVIAAITAASFFLDAVFAFAVAGQDPPLIRPAFAQARAHLAVILGSGGIVGVLLGLAAVVAPTWGSRWFTISMSIVIGIMMVSYVAVPARLIGVKATSSRRDKLAASAVGGALGAVACAPAYVLGRVGVILLGSDVLFALGVIMLAAGLMLLAAATAAVKAVKMGAKLLPTAAGQPDR